MQIRGERRSYRRKCCPNIATAKVWCCTLGEYMRTILERDYNRLEKFWYELRILEYMARHGLQDARWPQGTNSVSYDELYY